ncbi:MAG TPA: condensation domain-containing protein [Streptosporangiaceae bacterium]|nr:condensation domain-containing protein [Streptosporangiaceae bacterium]
MGGLAGDADSHDSDAQRSRLRTRQRWQEIARESRPADIRLALLASFTIDPLVPFLGTGLADAGIRASLWVAPFNQIEVQCLDDRSLTARYAPQLLIVHPRIEELRAGMGPGYERDLVNLADASLRAAGKWRAELIFVLPAMPEHRSAGVGDDGNADGVAATATRAREALRRRLAARDEAAIVDAEPVIRAIGSGRAYRPDLLATASIPFSDEYFELLGQRISRLVALRRRGGSPLIVIDAGALASEWSPGRAHGDGPASFERYLTEVCAHGASIALCNATERGHQQLAELVPVTAWRDQERGCAEQIRDLAGELATSLDLVGFVSTDVAACHSVAREIPEAKVLSLPRRREFWAQALGESAIVDQRPARAGQPDAVRQRLASPGAAVTLESFLAGLQLQVEVAPLTAADSEAAADLAVRVAEFHLNGEAWPAQRFAGLALSAGSQLHGVRVRDRFGDYGLAGVIASHRAGSTLEVDLWVLTCPVLGKGVEHRVLSTLEGLAGDCDTVAFRYAPAPRNEEFRRFLLALRPGGVPEDRPELVVVPRAALASPQPPRPAVRAPVPAAAGVRPAGRPGTAQFRTAAQILQAMRSKGQDSHGNGASEPRVEPRTETEKTLAGIFAAVLREPAVGADRNFFATGDSMRAVELIAKANQAGLRLTLRQVFRHQTVAALAEVATKVERRDGEAAISGPVPVLPLPAWFFGRNLPRPGHFNQSQRYEVPRDIEIAALRRAIAALVAHHQALRMRFSAEAGRWRQSDPGPPDDPPFLACDLSGTDPGEWDKALSAQETGLQLAMSPAEGRLIQFALFTFGPRRPPHLLVIVHHLAIDGISWRIVLEDLQDAYHQARQGEPVLLTPVSMPVLAWARRLSEFANSPQARDELPAWLAGSRAGAEALPLDHPGSVTSGAFTHFEEARFTADETRRVRDRAVHIDRVPVDVLLLATAMRTVARWTGREAILVDVVNHGREPFLDGADLSRTVGWLVVNVPVLVEIGAGQSLDDLVPAVNGQLRTWSSHHGLGDSLLRFLSEDESVRQQLAGLPGAELLFSYAGQFDHPASARTSPGQHPLLGRAVEPYSADMDSRGGTPYALQFDAMILGDEFHLTVCYRAANYRDSTARALLKGWATELRDLVTRSMQDA